MFKYFRLVFTFGIYIALNYFKMRYYGYHNDKVPYEKRFAFAKKWMEKMFKYGRMDVDVIGLENVPSGNGIAFCPNHQSFVDPTFLAYLDKKITPIAKAEIGKFPFFGHFTRALGSLYIARDDLRSVYNVSKRMTEILSNDENILVYPEGTRTKNRYYQMNEFKPATFKSIMNAKATIVPVVLWGYFAVLDPKCPHKRNKCYCEFLKPITYDDYKNMDNKQLSDTVFNLINDRVNKYIELDKDKLSYRDTIEE